MMPDPIRHHFQTGAAKPAPVLFCATHSSRRLAVLSNVHRS
jgi:hypothetical protein